MKAVILAGGGGTRLWPLSTPERPKQFQKLTSNKTMLEETINRLDFLKPEDIYISINKKHLALVQSICPQILAQNIIIEPALRDTASGIGLAASIIEKRHPGEVMALISADHLIKNKQEFQEKLLLAEQVAIEKNSLNIVEVPASSPNTNYGYVKLGDLDESINGNQVYHLDSFTEKPDAQTAKKFLESGNYLWNTGIYVWKSDVLLSHYKKLLPNSYEILNKIQESYDTETQDATINALYSELEKISIDYAIMEKVSPLEVRIIKADLGWSDIGNWEAIWHELPKNSEGNVTRGDAYLKQSSNSLIYSDFDKPVAVIGLDEIIVVDTKEGLIIAKKGQSKEIKKVLKEIRD